MTRFSHRLLQRFRRVRVLVIGDAMVDYYLVGEIERLSPAFAVPVVRPCGVFRAPGGAANVAANVAALGGRATLVSVTGGDADRRRLLEMLRKRRIRTTLLADGTRCTTSKTRFVGPHWHHLIRVDREATHDLAPAVEGRLLASIARHLAATDITILSDYGKGVVTKRVVEAVVRRATPVVANPKATDLMKYRGVGVLVVNEQDVRAHSLFQRDEPGALATQIAAALPESEILLTLGVDGMVMTTQGGKIVPIHAVDNVALDVTGAGDTVAATVALALAVGAPLRDAAELANVAASVVSAKPGTATLSPNELLARYRTLR